MTPRNRRVLTAALGALGLAAGASAATLAVHHGQHPTATAQAPRPLAPSSPPPAPPSSASQLPQVSLAGLRWTDYHGVWLPSSPQAGPADTSGGLASGYADTPLGALIAAENIAVRANAQWGPGIFTSVILSQVTGPEAGALLAACESDYSQESQQAGVTGGAPLGDVSVTEEAFRLAAWSPGSATFYLVSSGAGSDGTAVTAVTRVQVVWQGGDWRAVAPPGGDWGNSATQLTTLAGYTLFPGGH